ARASTTFAEMHPAQRLATRVGSAEQSNTSILYGRELIIKLFRRLEAGPNPDVETGRFLTETAHFTHVAPFLGEVSITLTDASDTTAAMLQGFVVSEGDGWEWFLSQLATAFPKAATLSVAPDPPAINFSREKAALPAELDIAQPSLHAAALLGHRTAQMHLA